MIKFIVDNKHFFITRTCIGKFPESKLNKIIIGKQYDLDTNGVFGQTVFDFDEKYPVCVNTDADVFKYIVSYIRFPDVQMEIPDEYLYNRIKTLAAYLELNELVNMLDEVHRGKLLLENLFNRHNDASPYSNTFNFETDNTDNNANNMDNMTSFQMIQNMNNITRINNDNNNGNNGDDDTSSVDSMGYNNTDSPKNEHRELTTDAPPSQLSLGKPQQFTELYNVVDSQINSAKDDNSQNQPNKPNKPNKSKPKIISNYVLI